MSYGQLVKNVFFTLTLMTINKLSLTELIYYFISGVFSQYIVPLVILKMERDNNEREIEAIEAEMRRTEHEIKKTLNSSDKP